MKEEQKGVLEKVKVWEEQVVIPTYKTGAPDKNPMFLEKRIYQGSSGKVYPHPVIEKILDEKEEKTYRAIWLENRYLKIMVLPELGGRIQRAYDKTNGYDFVYYNHVIKPALVGLAGPWISGGIEFNWPQHHRPSTFDPVNAIYQENPDGSATVFAGEIENMFRTKGMTAFTLYPDKAYLEINVRLYNRTNRPQTFLWWANPAVPVNDHTRSIFPPDVHAVMDHGKRDVSNFPIATGTYYKMDYSAGVDISRYKNIPVPTSYMAAHSDYDFVGGYDYGKQAGLLHVADHHISPGKKQWTWGCGEFGQAWDRNLTDSDGPYIELMTGCFTDNQPDFSWLMPYEEKTFTQYFMPYKGVGNVLNATKDLMAGFEPGTEGRLQAGVYSSSANQTITVQVREKRGEKILLEETVTLSPEHPWIRQVPKEPGKEIWDYEIRIFNASGRQILSASAWEPRPEKLPQAAKALPLPRETKTLEDLFLYGLHLEQYRHGTRDGGDYYLEGLRRSPEDVRLNHAYGKLLFGRGLFREARPYLVQAVKTMTRTNPNPYDGEPIYSLALADKYLGNRQQAYDGFYKATWNAAWQAAGFYQLACMDCEEGNFSLALSHIEKGLVYHWHNMKARVLKAAILRHLGRKEEARKWIQDSLAIDPLDFNCRSELLFLGEEEQKQKLQQLIGGNPNTCLELSWDYLEAGLSWEALQILNQYLEITPEEKVYPMICYYQAYGYVKAGLLEEGRQCAKRGQNASSYGCFPHRIDDILVLENAVRLLPQGDKAYYYLGCLWYDKKQDDRAIACWRQAKALNGAFPTVHRNLALAYFNKRGETHEALKEMEEAFRLDEQDARVLMELDQLKKKLGVSQKERIKFLEKYPELVAYRDDLYLEYLTMLGDLGDFQKERELILAHSFHPWEGGEGKVPAQYIRCSLALVRKAMEEEKWQQAETILEELDGPYPLNLGEGRLATVRENQIDYHRGRFYEAAGRLAEAKAAYEKAAAGEMEPAGMLYYNDQPPELIYYQGLALLRLGREKEAKGKFNQLIDYGEKHLFDQVQMDYFAVSLPDLQIFEEDLTRRSQIHCHYLMALGYLGKGEKSFADKAWAEVKKLDPNHRGGDILGEKE